MTDNEVIYAFTNGCSLLKSDDVDVEDLTRIRQVLDDCASELIPFVYKYIDKDKWCIKCRHHKGNLTTNCSHYYECFKTFDRPKFKKDW